MARFAIIDKYRGRNVIAGAFLGVVGVFGSFVLDTGGGQLVHTATTGSATAAYIPFSIIHPAGIPQWLVVIGADASAPKRVSIDRGFPIGVKFHLTITDVEGNPLPELNRPFVEDEVHDQLARHLRASLAIAGMTVKPEAPTPVASDLTTSWSVKATGTGSRFVGVLKTAMERRGIFGDTTTLVDLPGDVLLNISVDKPPRSLVGYLGIVGSVIGALLALTGLVSFLWSWLDRRNKQRAHNRKEKPKIHMP